MEAAIAIYAIVGSITLFTGLAILCIELMDGDDPQAAARVALGSFVWPLALLALLVYWSWPRKS